MSTTIQFRRDTAANWISRNPILAAGEVGLETDTNSYKIGDGITAWNTLVYNMLAPEITTLLLDGQSSDASVPAAGNLTVYSKAIGGRMMLKQVGPSGLATALQPFLARNKVGYWDPPGNNTTTPGVFGYTPVTAIGTATTRTIATTNLFTRMRRLGFPSSTNTAGSFGGARVSVAQVTVGDGSGNGGFYKICRFGCSDAVAMTGARQFVGVSSSVVAPTNVEPSTLTNSIGVGHGAADTNLMMYYGGSTAQTPVNLGSSFPANTLSTDVYELALFSGGSDSTHVYWEVTRLNTGDVASGTFTGVSGTALPLPTTLLTYQLAWRTNNTAAGKTPSLDIMSDYIETDN